MAEINVPATTGTAGVFRERANRLFRALHSQGFRLYLSAHFLSSTGLWIQSLAQGWLLYRLTDSAALLGFLGFIQRIPVLFFGPLGGMAADRFTRKRILFFTQTLFTLQSVVLAVLTLTGQITATLIFVLAFFYGAVSAFDMPARQSFVAEIITKTNLMNGIALNSSAFNLARLLGPAAAGYMVARWSEGWCFLANAFSFLFMLVALFYIKAKLRPSAKRRNVSPLRFLKGGFSYVAKTPHVKALFLLLAVISFVGFPFSIFLPIFAKDILHGDARTLGLLASAMGVGALVGALFMAFRTRLQGLGRLTAFAMGGFGLFLSLMALSKDMKLSLLATTGLGFSMMLQLNATNTLLQSFVPEALRGRLMSLYVTVLMGCVPFGSLLQGSLVKRWGAMNVIAVGGLVCLFASWRFYRKIPTVRRAMQAAHLIKDYHGVEAGI